ncbi:MAG: hypothetical protein Kow0089_06100 [Desulfobulbaceae bacterium]
MKKRLAVLLVVLALSAVAFGCARKEPPYDARAIDSSEVDTPAKTPAQPAAGGGKALNERQW